MKNPLSTHASSFIVIACWVVLGLFACAFSLPGCEDSTDEKQSALQDQALEQAYMKVGMPSTPSFQEKRLAKDLYELRDKAISTHSYLMSDMQACLVYLGPSIGYGLPYATQYTAPTRLITHGGSVYAQVPQAEPNGLFMPASADGTWIMLKDPDGPDVKPVYVESHVIVSPFRLTSQECAPRQGAAPPTAPAAVKASAGEGGAKTLVR